MSSEHRKYGRKRLQEPPPGFLAEPKKLDPSVYGKAHVRKKTAADLHREWKRRQSIKRHSEKFYSLPSEDCEE